MTVPKKEWNKASITELALLEAEKHGINSEKFLKTIACEVKKDEGGEWVADAQSDIHGPHGRENSWGVMQIHLPSHPEITKSQAQDPAFAIPWAANEFAEGRANKWSCYRKL